MKKILCLILLMATLCTMYTPVYAENALTEALEYLSAAQINFEYEEETIQPDQRVTRATFAQAVSKLFDLSERKASGVYYHDVSTDHWAFDNIGVLTEQKVITGNGNKYFRPDEYITREEVATIVVSALGYGVYAENLGGYSEGYIKVANELELFKHCSTDSEITLSSVIIMLRNTLDANLATVMLKGNGTIYTMSEDETVLSYYHNLYYAKGTLTGCDGISFKSTKPIDHNVVIIDDVEYDTELNNMINMIGTEVEFLYKADEKDSEERTLVWVKSRGSNAYIDIKKDKYCSFDSDENVFYYAPEDSQKLKKIKISEGLIVVYNGAIATESVEDILNSDKYDVRFIKSKNSSVYDIAIVWEYDNIVVGKVDFHEEVIYDKFNQGKILDISIHREKININGETTLEQLEEGDVLSYYESKDRSILTIDVSKNAVDVTAKWIKDDDGEKSLITDGEEYIFYDYNTDATVLFNESVKLYLDKNGFIADIEKVKTDGFPAYLIKSKYNDFDEILTLTTLDYDGNVVQRETVEKVRFNDVRTKSDVVHSMLTADKITRQQVVILKVNEAGQITDIDTTEQGGTLECHAEKYTGQYKHHGRLVPKYLISPSTVIFSVPSVPSDNEKDYLVKGKSDLSNDQWYTFDMYKYSKEVIGYEEILVIKDKNWGISGNSGKIYVLVDKIIEIVNSYGEAVEELSFNREGNSLKATTTSDFSLIDKGVKSGDLVQLAMNMNGEIEDAEIKYSYGSGDRPINTMYNAEPGLRVVYAHEKVGNVLRIGHASGADYDEIFEMPEDRIVVYDRNAEEKIRKGTMWDILTFKDVGNSCTTVAIQTIDETPYSVVIYK